MRGARRKLGRDRHVKTEWGDRLTRGSENRDFGFDDHGWKLQTSEEADMYEDLKAEGWTVHKHGWPDFMATRGEEVRLIEVKSITDQKRQSQMAVHAGLQRLGLAVEVWLDDNPNRTPRKYLTWKPKPIKRPRT